MSLYSEYLKEIDVRKADLGLNPKPIDAAVLLFYQAEDGIRDA